VLAEIRVRLADRVAKRRPADRVDARNLRSSVRMSLVSGTSIRGLSAKLRTNTSSSGFGARTKASAAA